jgi:hypothetical protein
MADPRRFELDELTVRPGTYFNPQTEVLLVVDDSLDMDQTTFDADEHEGSDWVLVSDEVPIDEAARDELLERFQVRYHAGASTGTAGDDVPDEGAEDDDKLEPDDEPEELD